MEPTTTPAAPPSPDILRFLFDFNHRALGMNLEGWTHEESLIGPKPAGHCASWVLGHILANRTSVLTMLGETPVWSEEDEKPYDQGAPPLGPKTARPWESMLQDLETTQQKIRDGIARLTPEKMATKEKPEAKRTLGEQLHFMQFHEAYHAGQLGLLRRIVGKSGAI